ncbi:MAG: hypothetical protein ABEK00_02905 [Candidatus Nanohaloarchaea archaeon]
MEFSNDIPVEEALKLRKRNRLFWKNVFSPVGYRKLKDQIDELKVQVEGAEPENRIEEIVLEDMRNFSRASEDLADYASGRGDIPTPEAVDSIYGERTFDRLKNDLENYDWDSAYRSQELEIERKTVDPRRFRERLEKELQKVSSTIEEYARSEGLVPEGLEMNIVPIPSSRKQRAFYNSEQKEVNIGLDYFRVVKNDGGLQIEATEAIYALFHEFVGHAAHHHNSLKLEYPEFTSRPAENFSASAHAEAVGIMANRNAERFIEKKMNELNVTERGFEIKKTKLDVKGNAGKILNAYYREMEARGEIESAEEKLSQLANQKWARNAVENWNDSYKYALKETTYTAGENLLEKIDVEDYQALTTGLWTPETLPKYLDYREEK